MALSENDALRRENESLRERLSRLSGASVRISESLDFDAVLQDVVDSARALTDSRYGGMAVFDESGGLQSFVTSGFSVEEQRRFLDLPEGQALFTYFRQLSEPFRVRDFQMHIRSLGFAGLRFSMRVGEVFSFLAAPILYRGESIGNIYLAEKETAEEFTRDDEEILVMFASQAALVIANAGRYRDEQRSRSDLQALIDTSPVGVVVLDGRTGEPVSFNREAQRIFESLRLPDRPLEALLDTMTIRRADGREVSLEEFTVAQALS